MSPYMTYLPTKLDKGNEGSGDDWGNRLEISGFAFNGTVEQSSSRANRRVTHLDDPGAVSVGRE